MQGHKGKSKWIKEGLANGKARKYFNHGQKSWDTFAFLGRFPIHTAQPSPHPTNNVGRTYPEFFQSFNFVHCIGLGEGELNKSFEKDDCFNEGTKK